MAAPFKSNWQKLLDSGTVEAKKKRKRSSSPQHSTTKRQKIRGQDGEQVPQPTSHIALDCEFVGVGKDGKGHCLARVSVVNYAGEVLYDKYVRPTETVTDYRTHVSGIRPSDLTSPAAVAFKECQAEVARLLHGRTLIGHGVRKDLQVMLLDHPRRDTRDTTLCKILCPKRPIKLKTLLQERLGLSVQQGEHSSVEDARGVLALYKSVRTEWETLIRFKGKGGRMPSQSKSSTATTATVKKRGKRKANERNGRRT